MRVVIADDSVLLREGAVRLLDDAGFDVVGQAGDGEDLLRKVRAHKPDVAVVDIRMPPTHVDEGLQAAKVIRSELPDVGVLVLSQYVEERYAVELLADGAEGVGYLLKDRIAEVDRFVEAVRRVGEGGSVLDPEVVAQAGDADDLLRKVRAHKPDVAVIDIRMPPDNVDDGLRAALEIRSELPAVGLLLLSQYVEERYLSQLLAGGAEGVGYLLKDRVADVERLSDAVRRVAEGGSVLDPEVVAHMLGRRERDEPLDELTPREREVLGLMAEGRTNRAIAEQMMVSERAVERHVTAIFSKLGLTTSEADHRRVLAVLAFLRD